MQTNFVPDTFISRRFFFLPFLCQDSAVEGVSSSSSTKDVGSSSPLTDRKKHRRKKSMNQKGDATLGQADGKRQELKMCFFFNIQHLNSREVTFYKFTQDFISTFIIFSLASLWHFLSSHAAKRKMWKLKSFGSLRNVSKTGNVDLTSFKQWLALCTRLFCFSFLSQGHLIVLSFCCRMDLIQMLDWYSIHRWN